MKKSLSSSEELLHGLTLSRYLSLSFFFFFNYWNIVDYVVLFGGAQQGESVMHVCVCVYIFIFILFFHVGYCKPLSRCALQYVLVTPFFLIGLQF